MLREERERMEAELQRKEEEALAEQARLKKKKQSGIISKEKLEKNVKELIVQKQDSVDEKRLTINNDDAFSRFDSHTDNIT